MDVNEELIFWENSKKKIFFWGGRSGRRGRVRNRVGVRVDVNEENSKKKNWWGGGGGSGRV